MSPSKIVITGTIASGKSTLSKLISKMGFEVISADEINKDLLKEGAINYLAIKNSGEFDQAFIDNRLDKKLLAAIIFNDSKKMAKINQLTHKNILQEINKRVAQSSDKAVFIEIPLYFQTKEKFEADEVWLVIADYETQISRLMKRDNIDLSYAKTKIESQSVLEDMKANSDLVFDNSGTVDQLEEKSKIMLKEKRLIWSF